MKTKDGKMTVSEATEWVRANDDIDDLDNDELEAAFAAIVGRAADDEDREQGLWSHLCAAALSGSQPPRGGE